MSSASNKQNADRLHLLGIRHHGPGSAILLRQALDTLDPACVLIEGPSEGDVLIPFVEDEGMKPPVAMLFHAVEDANVAFFMPFAEFSPEWVAMQWALMHKRPVRCIDWPAAVSLARQREAASSDTAQADSSPDALDLLAEAAGFEDGETFWNTLVEQHGGVEREHSVNIFRAIETAMTEARSHEESLQAHRDHARDLVREAFMRTHIRAALKEHEGAVAVVCGAWHLNALREPHTAAEDRAIIKELPRIKVEATWVPWTDSRLSARSGYGAGIISPGWYRHLWSLYAREEASSPASFAAMWQARTAHLLRAEGYGATSASTIDATQLALSLASLRELPRPGLAEMREASLATLCHGNPVPLALIERRLYVGERVGEIGEHVPQMPLARDLALWQRRTRLKPEDVELEIRLDLRSEAGLLKSTLLHRLQLINVPWGRLLDAQAGRGTFREVWMLHWKPELSVALAEALVYGATIENAAANATIERARAMHSVQALAGLVQSALVADLPAAATECIALLQAAAVEDSDVTSLMLAVEPLVRVLRYGSARPLPELDLQRLIVSLAAEVNANVRFASRALDNETAAARLNAMEIYDGALHLFGDAALLGAWTHELEAMVDDDQVVGALAGLSLRSLLTRGQWAIERVAATFERNTHPRMPQQAGQFLEGFLRGGSEILLQDEPLLHLLDRWLCGLEEEPFTESLPLLRRVFSGFDSVARRRVFAVLKHGPRQERERAAAHAAESYPAFEAALPLLRAILGTGGAH